MHLIKVPCHEHLVLIKLGDVLLETIFGNLLRLGPLGHSTRADVVLLRLIPFLLLFLCGVSSLRLRFHHYLHLLPHACLKMFPFLGLFAIDVTCCED